MHCLLVTEPRKSLFEQIITWILFAKTHSGNTHHVQPQEIPLRVFFSSISVQLYQGIGRNLL